MMHSVVAFYKFADIGDADILRVHIRQLCERLAIKGTVLVAAEGINGTVAGGLDALHILIETLCKDSRFASMSCKWSSAATQPFKRLKVRVKPEIVTFGVPGLAPHRVTGAHVAPQDWNALISSPDVAVIDTRNDYEIGVGSFRGAIDPKTQCFSEFAKFVDEQLSPTTTPKVAMFCTGGIRCEKASAYLLAKGFRQVFQLDGGILKYLETIPPEQSLFEGECFVFDERVALEHGVREGSHQHCVACGFPVSAKSGAACGNCRAEPGAV